jgi:hypothetical protein
MGGYCGFGALILSGPGGRRVFRFLFLTSKGVLACLRSTNVETIVTHMYSYRVFFMIGETTELEELYSTLQCLEQHFGISGV